MASIPSMTTQTQSGTMIDSNSGITGRKKSRSITLSLASKKQIPTTLNNNNITNTNTNTNTTTGGGSISTSTGSTSSTVSRSNSTRRKLFSSLFGSSSSTSNTKKESERQKLEPINTSSMPTRSLSISANSRPSVNNSNVSTNTNTASVGSGGDLSHGRPRSGSSSSNKSISIGILQTGLNNYSADNNSGYSGSAVTEFDESVVSSVVDSGDIGDRDTFSGDEQLRVLEPLKFKRVQFQVDEFELDPPQQIPNRKPRVGALLLPYELISNIMIDEGISTNSAGPSTTHTSNTKESKEYKILVDQFNASLNDSLKYQQESYFRAKKIEEELVKQQQLDLIQQQQQLQKLKRNKSLKQTSPTASTTSVNSGGSAGSSSGNGTIVSPVAAHAGIKTLASTIKSVLPQGHVMSRESLGKTISPVTPLSPAASKTLSISPLNTALNSAIPSAIPSAAHSSAHSSAHSPTPTSPTSVGTPMTPLDSEHLAGMFAPDLQSRHSEDTIVIDKPIHRHHSFIDELPQNVHDTEHTGDEMQATAASSVATDVEKELTLDKVYTRCCHLREILPIPITLKQLRKKSSSPQHRLAVLKFLNPKPTLIDILSFTDFTSIVANLDTLVFDNVSLNNHMVKIILLSLPKSLKKLSLKNVPLSRENWMYLCKYLLLNEELKTIDISQTKLKHPGPHDAESYLRADLNWELFWRVSAQRNTPVELLYVNSVTPGAPYSTLPPTPPPPATPDVPAPPATSSPPQ